MKDIYIREAKIEDAEKLLNYTKKVGKETNYLTFGEEGIKISVEEEKEFIENFNNRYRSVLYVALDADEIIGVCNLSGSSLDRSNHVGVMGISILKKYWNRGLGTEFIKRIINYAQDTGIELIKLDVVSENIRAKKLYEKFGFIKVGTLPNFYKIDDEYYSMDIMYLEIVKKL